MTKKKGTMVNLDEARAEAITAGLLLLVIGAFLVLNLSQGIAMLVAGLVLLGSGVYQSQRGWHVAITTWLLGIVLFFGGLGVRMYLIAVLPINWVGIALFLIGAYLIYQMLVGHRGQ